jgi:hypothetical protein
MDFGFEFLCRPMGVSDGWRLVVAGDADREASPLLVGAVFEGNWEDGIEMEVVGYANPDIREDDVADEIVVVSVRLSEAGSP